ncbi:MAG: TM2 domain-containing protein [Candidatus Heimdallarchaeota archaeon]
MNQSNTSSRKEKFAAGLLAIFLGGLGIHKFYLGSWGWGIIYILFLWTVIPLALGFIEGIVLIAMDETKFDVRYNQTPPHPFKW